MKTTKVTLDTPVTIDGAEVREITLHRPLTGQLRGIRLLEVHTLNVDAVAAVLVRTSQPVLTEGAIDLMDPADFTALAQAVLGFFEASTSIPPISSPTSPSSSGGASATSPT
ncbi:phage tail assembly protein (plasmid) [Tistrella mobilis]|uniref:phage tail assembly protein n=1 Tax=Tistrella mobilis TaxID=171437 RepID=UPI003557BAE6